MTHQQPPTEEDFVKSVKGDAADDAWAVGRAPYLYRAMRPLFAMYPQLSGPTLDVSSGGGAIYPAIKRFLPVLLPYSTTEIKSYELVVDGDSIPCISFDCEKDRLALPDQSVGAIFFLDVIEHLLLDPVWTLLEFNRVLKPGGHLVISTPNTAGIFKVFNILQGYNPMGESHYKPCAVYQRHNREWTTRELNKILHILGFNDVVYTTYSELLEPGHLRFIELMRSLQVTTLPDEEFGPEIVIVGRKQNHLTLDTCTDPDTRWPTFLYSEHAAYRKRPLVFPNLVGDDFQ